MAIINSYPTATPTGSDILIGTDTSTTPNSTKTFSVDSINALAPQGTVTSVALTAPSAFSVTGSPITSSGTIAITGAGSASQVILGNGTLGSLPGGPFLPLAGGTMAGNIVLPDSVKLEIGNGTSGDLRIYHDGANSYIDEQGTGNLIIKGSTNVLISTSSGGQLAQFTEGGSAFLYYAGSNRLLTTPDGVTVDGDIIVNGGDITLGGTGRIQGIDTVSASTDAASKAYVDGIVGYKTYVAQITQSGTNAPVATVLQNDTGLTFTWTRNALGVYEVGASSSFVVNKTWAQITGSNTAPSTSVVILKNITTSQITFNNVLVSSAALVEGIAIAFVEIRIYP